jgi:hypothetical protein
VIDKKPSKATLYKYLYHLRRAFGQVNRPPPFVEMQGPDKVLIQRRNRYIGVSREGPLKDLQEHVVLFVFIIHIIYTGTVCISWPTSDKTRNFDLSQWPSLFQGIYFILSQQA